MRDGFALPYTELVEEFALAQQFAQIESFLVIHSGR